MISRAYDAEREELIDMLSTVLLEKVIMNAEAALITMPKILELSDNLEFSRVISEKERSYKEIYKKSVSLNNGSYKDLELEKVRGELLSELNTVRAADTSKLAETVMVCSTIGAIDITRQLRLQPDAPCEVKSVALSLLHTEEDSIEEMKPYI